MKTAQFLVGTYRGGLNRYVRRQAAFQYYKIDKEVYAILEDRSGNRWLGTDFYGVFRNDQQRQRWVHYVHDPQNPKSLGGDGVMAICEDQEGKIWIGTSGVVSRYNSEADNFVSYHYPSGNSKNSGCKILYEDREGDLWLGTNGTGAGLKHWDREKKTFTSCPLDSQDTEVWSLAEGNEGELWVGTFGRGLYRFDKKTKVSVPYPCGLNNSHEMSTIYSLYVDPVGAVWAGTFAEGLKRYDPRTKQVEQYTEREGLPDNFVKCILPDAHGNLLLSTDKGLSKFDPRTRTFRNYTVQDGLLSNVFLSGAAYKSREGRLFFGCDKGGLAFHPDSLRDNEHILPLPLPVQIFDGAALRSKPVQRFRSSSLHRQNFSFEFAALDLLCQKNQYAYKLEGSTEIGFTPEPDTMPITPTSILGIMFLREGSNNDGLERNQRRDQDQHRAAVLENVVVYQPFLGDPRHRPWRHDSVH
jgi:streptogramin lyase